MNKDINLKILEFKNNNNNIINYLDNNQLNNGESILKRELYQEYSINYLELENELKLKSKEGTGSILASRLIQGIELFKIFLKLFKEIDSSGGIGVDSIGSNDHSNLKQQLQCIEPLAKLLLFEPYIINEKTLSNKVKEKVIEMLRELILRYPKSSCQCNELSHKYINVSLIGLNLMMDNKDARDELVQVLDGLLDSDSEYNQDLDFTFMRGKLYLFNGHFKSAFNDFNFVITKNQHYNEYIYFYIGEALRYYGLELCDIHLLENSINAYKEYIQRSPNDALRIDFTYYCISHLYYIIQNYQQSKLYFEKGRLSSSKQLSIFNINNNNNHHSNNYIIQTFNLDQLLKDKSNQIKPINSNNQ